jgi:hypothetical protein
MITLKSAEQLANLLKKVEQALAIRCTKAMVVKTLSEANECSPKSSGFEKSFLKALKAKNVPLTQKFATLMEEPNFQATPEGNGKFLNLKGVSVISIDKYGDATVSFIGGGKLLIGPFDESKFHSASNQIVFNVSD